MADPNEKAIDQAERLLRKIRTGEITGFVAVATDDDDGAHVMMGGSINLTTTVCLLEDLKLQVLHQWTQRFHPDEGPAFGIVEEDEDG